MPYEENVGNNGNGYGEGKFFHRPQGEEEYPGRSMAHVIPHDEYLRETGDQGDFATREQQGYPEEKYPQEKYSQEEPPQETYPQENYPQEKYPQEKMPVSDQEGLAQMSGDRELETGRPNGDLYNKLQAEANNRAYGGVGAVNEGTPAATTTSRRGSKSYSRKGLQPSRSYIGDHASRPPTVSAQNIYAEPNEGNYGHGSLRQGSLNQQPINEFYGNDKKNEMQPSMRDETATLGGRQPSIAGTQRTLQGRHDGTGVVAVGTGYQNQNDGQNGVMPQSQQDSMVSLGI